MTTGEYTFSDLHREVTRVKKEIRQTYRKARVYFDNPYFYPSNGYLRLIVPFRVADGNGGFVLSCGSPDQTWSVAL